MKTALDLIELEVAALERGVAEWEERIASLLAVGMESGTEKPLIAMYEHGMRVGKLKVYEDIRAFLTRVDRENEEGMN